MILTGVIFLRFKKKILSFILAFIFLINSSFVVFAEIGVENECSGFLISDFETGEVLEGKNMDKVFPMASISKIMTYIVVKDTISQGKLKEKDIVEIDRKSASIEGSNMALKVGEKLTVEELLTGLMVVSANDAAHALAIKVSGTEEDFVKKMNLKASEIGLNSGKFYNSSGLQQGENQNKLSIKDIFKMSRYCIQKYPEVLYYSRYKFLEMPERNFKKESTIPLVGEIKGVDGLKTGYTEEAGYCLVSTMNVAESGGGEFRLITVIMGTSSIKARATLTATLLNYATSNYAKKKLVEDGKIYETIKSNASKEGILEIVPKKSVSKIVKKDSEIVYESKIDENKTKPPLKSGEKVGELSIKINNKTEIKTDLIAKNSLTKVRLFTRILRFIVNVIRSILGLFKFS